MKKFLSLTICSFITISLFGQTLKIDSLKLLVRAAKNDRSKLNAILALGDEFQSLPKDTLWNYAIKAKKLAAKINETRSFSLAIVAQGHAYVRYDNTDSAKALVEPELLKYKVDNPADRGIYFKLEDVKIDCMGVSYLYKDAIAEVYEEMRLAEKYKDSMVVARNMNILSVLNYDMNFVEQARGWSYKALSYTSNAPRFYTMRASIYANLGDNYQWIGKIDSASYYINKAIKLSRQSQNLYYLSIVLQRQASIYSKNKDFAKAEAAILESINLIAKVEGKEPQQDKLLVLASIYRHSGQIEKAIQVLNDGLAADANFKSNSAHRKKGDNSRDLQQVYYYQELARCYKDRGDSKNYEATLEKVIAGKDAFYEANSASAIAELETKYEVQKKEATIAQQKLAITKKNYMLYGSIMVVFLGSVIILLVFKDLRRRQKLRLQKLHEEEQLLAAQAVIEAEETERKRIAADLHDNLGAQLSFIKRNVNFIMDQPEGFSQEDERRYLGYVNDIAQNAMIDLRETIWVLNRDEVNIQEFADKLKSYLRQQLLDRQMISWDFKETITQDWKLSSGEVMHLFRIMQELVSNIIKHSGASHIGIKFSTERPDAYQLEIHDNGKGFNTDTKYEGHYGLENIQKRADEIGANLLIESDQGTGTQVALTKGQNNAYALYNKGEGSSNFIQ